MDLCRNRVAIAQAEARTETMKRVLQAIALVLRGKREKILIDHSQDIGGCEHIGGGISMDKPAQHTNSWNKSDNLKQAPEGEEDVTKHLVECSLVNSLHCVASDLDGQWRKAKLECYKPGVAICVFAGTKDKVSRPGKTLRSDELCELGMF